MEIRGKIIKYGDNIDTDVIIAGHRLVYGSNISLMSKYAMETVDKDFHVKIGSGRNIIVSGRNFGSGSSRQQAAEVLKECGIRLIISDSMARIFYRNAVNIGLPVLIAEGISSITEDGDVIEADLESGEIKNLSNLKSLNAKPIPPFLLDILSAGGLVNHLKNRIHQLEVGK